MKPLVEYRTWYNMLRRCQNPALPSYRHYGGRGIAVCERWQTFDNFLQDMGFRPGPEYSLDRIDCNGNYEPKNCRWATQKQQARNKRCTLKVEVDGQPKPFVELAEASPLDDQLVYSRLNRGWPVELAVSAPKGSRTARKPRIKSNRSKLIQRVREAAGLTNYGIAKALNKRGCKITVQGVIAYDKPSLQSMRVDVLRELRLLAGVSWEEFGRWLEQDHAPL